MLAQAQQAYRILRSPRINASSEEGRSEDRYRRVAATALSSLVARAVTVGSVFITVPLTLRYLGTERFGLWMTISSITAMLTVADFGIGNGLMNAISAAHGREDRAAAQKATSTSFIILLVSAAVMAALVPAVSVICRWVGLFKNVHGQLLQAEAGYAAATLVALFALNMPFNTARSVQSGYQEGYTSNAWQILGSVSALLGTVLAAYAHAGLPWLVLAATGGPVLAMAANWSAQFFWLRPWLLPRFRYFSWPTCRRTLRAGAAFTLLQAFAFLGASTDNLIIVRIFGASAVAGYSVLTRLTTVIILLQAITGPLWPAVGEAVARGDYAWTARMFSRALRLCLVVGAIAGLGLLVLGKPFIKAWAGADLVPSSVLVAGTAAWIIVCSIYAPVSAVLSNEMFLKQYLGIYGAAAILAFLLKVAFACLFGISGVMWGMVLGYGALSLYAVSMVHRCLRPRGTEPSFANLPLRTFLCGVRDRAKTQARTQGSQC